MPASALLLRLCCIGAAADDDDDGDDDDDDDDNDADDDDDDPVIDGGSTIASPCPTRWWRRGSAPSVAMVMVILEGSQPSAISYLMRKAIRCHQRCHPRCHPRCDEAILEGPQPSAVSYPETCISPSEAEIVISFVSASGRRAISCSMTQRASRSTSAARIVVVGSALNHAPATDCSEHSALAIRGHQSHHGLLGALRGTQRSQSEVIRAITDCSEHSEALSARNQRSSEPSVAQSPARARRRPK